MSGSVSVIPAGAVSVAVAVGRTVMEFPAEISAVAEVPPGPVAVVPADPVAVSALAASVSAGFPGAPLLFSIIELLDLGVVLGVSLFGLLLTLLLVVLVAVLPAPVEGVLLFVVSLLLGCGGYGHGFAVVLAAGHVLENVIGVVEGYLHERDVVLETDLADGVLGKVGALPYEVGDVAALDPVRLAEADLEGGESLPLRASGIGLAVVPVFLDLHLPFLLRTFPEYHLVDGVDGLEAVWCDLLHLGVGFLLAHAHELPVAGVYQRNRDSFLPRPSGPAYPVQVGLRINGEVIVNDEVHVPDVETPGGHVGGQ